MVELTAPEAFHCGYAAIVGWPNVGKSSLLNSFLGAKLSIVSPKPQTTRNSILGILNEPNSQLIFVDTPGWLKPSDTAQTFMKKAIMRSVYDDADVLLWVIDPVPMNDDLKALGETLVRAKKPLVVCVNKIDTVKDKETLDALVKSVKETVGPASTVITASAKTGQNVDRIKKTLADLLPANPPFFPTDQMTDRWERFFVGELIRETIFKLYHEEVPHACAVQVTDFEEREGRKDHIKATIFVETEGQKKIILGKGGLGIKTLGQTSRKEIEGLLNRPVFLEIHIKVRKHWRQDGLFIKSLEEGEHF